MSDRLAGDALTTRPAGTAARYALACLLAAVALTVLLGLGRTPSVPPGAGGTVLFCAVDDAYRPLAEEMARVEGLLLADDLDVALAHDPRYLLWVAAPETLDDAAMVRLGAALRARGLGVSVGLITGGTVESARALWQRDVRDDGALLSIIPREGPLLAYCWPSGGDCAPIALDLFGALRSARLVSYQGHGSARAWHLGDDWRLEADWLRVDRGGLEGAVVYAGSCQTLRPWVDGSIALEFVDAGAAAYLGYVHSPLGYVMGEPRGFVLQHTWPGYTVGDLAAVWNRGLSQGYLAWPYLVVLGDPRLALADEAPYAVSSDESVDGRRVVTLADAPPGFVPVRVPDAAGYAGARVDGGPWGGGVAWRGDPFYDADLQMLALGADLHLLVHHDGGPLELTLYPRVPWHWRLWEPLVDALDQITVLSHVQGNLLPSLLAAVGVALLVAWRLRRGRVPWRRHALAALAAGLTLTVGRTAYALARCGQLALLFEGYLRTLDLGFRVEPAIVLSCLFVTTGAVWLGLNARRRGWRILAGLLALYPTTLLAPFWLAVSAGINLMARNAYGAPLYGYGVAAAATVVALLEAAGLIAVVGLAGRYQPRAQ